MRQISQNHPEISKENTCTVTFPRERIEGHQKTTEHFSFAFHHFMKHYVYVPVMSGEDIKRHRRITTRLVVSAFVFTVLNNANVVILTSTNIIHIPYLFVQASVSCLVALSLRRCKIVLIKLSPSYVVYIMKLEPTQLTSHLANVVLSECSPIVNEFERGQSTPSEEKHAKEPRI